MNLKILTIKEVSDTISKLVCVSAILLVTGISFAQTKWVEKDSGSYNNLSVIRYQESLSKKNGLYQIYTNGVLIIQGYYTNDKKDSNWTYYCDQKITAKKIFKNDNPVGKWLFYDANKKVNILYDFDANAYYLADKNNKNKNYQKVALKDFTHEALPLFSDFEVKCFLENNLEYPKKALSKKEHGWVKIKMKIDTIGFASDFEVMQSVSEALDKEALKKVKLFPFHFIPASKNGIVTESNYVMTVKFPQQMIN